MMRVQVQKTSDPCKIKFILDRPLFPKGYITFKSEAHAAESEWALALISLEEVREVTFAENLIWITGKRREKMYLLETDVLLLLDELIDQPPSFERKLVTEGEKVEKVKRLLSDMVQPALDSDGGGVTFVGCKDHKIYLRVQNACVGCPSAEVGLKEKIEGLMCYYLEEKVEVLFIP